MSGGRAEKTATRSVPRGEWALSQVAWLICTLEPHFVAGHIATAPDLSKRRDRVARCSSRRELRHTSKVSSGQGSACTSPHSNATGRQARRRDVWTRRSWPCSRRGQPGGQLDRPCRRARTGQYPQPTSRSDCARLRTRCWLSSPIASRSRTRASSSFAAEPATARWRRCCSAGWSSTIRTTCSSPRGRFWSLLLAAEFFDFGFR